MFCYFFRIGAKRYKTEELLANVEAFPNRFHRERGCLGYDIFCDLDRPDTFTMVAKWQNYQDMQKHFQTLDFKILIGAAKVLGASSEVLITETVPLTPRSRGK
ncbi:MAG: putative quinol monooxygenase [Desulfocapsaceae bacterium]